MAHYQPGLVGAGVGAAVRVAVELSALSLQGGAPKVVSLESFTGAAAGVATVDGRVFVADADGVIRVYTTGPDGAAVPAPALSLEVSP